MVVIGASTGIGRATAIAAHRAGAKLALVARDAEQLEAVAQKLAAERTGHRPAGSAPPTGEVLTFPLDVRQRQRVVELTDAVVDRFGRIDSVVFAAGWNVPRRAVAELSDTDWDTIVDTNLRAAFLVTQATLPVMKRQGGGLLMYLSSSGAKQADQSGAAYQASKAGLAALAHATMVEHRGEGIRTTVLFPGLTDTPFVRHRASPPDPAAMQAALRPEDVAAACLFVLQLPRRAYVPELLLYPTNL